MDNNSNFIILKKAKSILSELGYTVYRSYYEDDLNDGMAFDYDKLKIYMDNYSNLYIIINNKTVFSYCLKDNIIKSIPGEWPSLINAIYKEIPEILEKRRLKKEEIKTKVNEMKSLQYYLSSYIKLYEKNNESIILANKRLLDKDIVVKKETRYYTTFSTIQYYEIKHSYNVFVITYKEQPVMEFNDNIFNVLPNIDYQPENNENVNKFKSGEWVSIFKNIISFVNQYDEKLTNSKIEQSSKQMIKRVKNII